MARGAVTLTKTASNGQVTSYGVPGETDVAMGYVQTKPLATAGENIADCYVDVAVIEFTNHFSAVHTDNDLVVYCKFFDRLADESSTAFFTLSSTAGDDNPLFIDEDDIKVGRYCVLKIEDSSIHDWNISRIQLFGELDGDQGQVI